MVSILRRLLLNSCAQNSSQVAATSRYSFSSRICLMHPTSTAEQVLATRSKASCRPSHRCTFNLFIIASNKFSGFG